jgi:hypothetical protein
LASSIYRIYLASSSHLALFTGEKGRVKKDNRPPRLPRKLFAYLDSTNQGYTTPLFLRISQYARYLPVTVKCCMCRGGIKPVRLSHKEDLSRKYAFDRWKAASIMCAAARYTYFSRSARCADLVRRQYTAHRQHRDLIKPQATPRCARFLTDACTITQPSRCRWTQF